MIGLSILLFSSCEGYRSGSSIPNTAVQIELNTTQFPAYNPHNATAWFTVTSKGYFDSQGNLFYPHKITDYCGYCGILVTIDYNERIFAFDLACPSCLKPIQPESYMFSECPYCGEVFQTDYGTGIPTKGIVTEGLKRYNVVYSNNTIRVYNR